MVGESDIFQSKWDNALASVNADTLVAPASMRAATVAESVDPVVASSSMSRIDLPFVNSASAQNALLHFSFSLPPSGPLVKVYVFFQNSKCDEYSNLI
jgi:hypothetical protein